MAGLFHPLLCSFCGFTALFPKGTVLLQLLFACLFQGFFSNFQLLTDNVSYSLGNAGKKKTIPVLASSPRRLKETICSFLTEHGVSREREASLLYGSSLTSTFSFQQYIPYLACYTCDTKRKLHFWQKTQNILSLKDY